jgi:predicted dithiol-disulfide oxidoreductase (DUF899 family)
MRDRLVDEFRRAGSSVLGERTGHRMKISHARLIDLFESRSQLVVYRASEGHAHRH